MERNVTSASKEDKVQKTKPIETYQMMNSEHNYSLTKLQQSIGNRALCSLIQAKLKISQPGDVYEQEADRVAERVMAMSESLTEMEGKTSLKGNNDNLGMVQLKTTNLPSQSFNVPPQVEEVLNSPGKPLDEATKTIMESRFSFDFSQVKVHTGKEAESSTRQLGALAYTVGKDIVFSNDYHPGNMESEKLLAHELAHVVQQSGGTAPFIGRQIVPEDVSPEMVGIEFILVKTFDYGGIKIPQGTKVKVIDWVNESEQVTVEIIGNSSDAGGFIEVPKLLIRPHHQKVVKRNPQLVKLNETSYVGILGADKDIEKYDAGVETIAWDLESRNKNLANWQAQKARYKTPKAKELYQKEETRLKELQENSQTDLNRKLIRQTMYNRFDEVINKWVRHYNSKFRPKVPLDPNIIKSILFQETRFGTNGKYMLHPSNSGTKTVKDLFMNRFNLGQTIDSVGPQQLIMIEEMAPDIFSKYNLTQLKAQNRKKGMTNEEFEVWNGGAFVSALYEFNSKKVCEKNVMGNVGIDNYEDYEFWIRTSVRWLFEKYRSLKNPSWEEAVRAYNGSKEKAEDYRQQVINRVGKKGPVDVSGE